MSVDYYLACLKCSECIHVAHDGLSGFAFYSGEADCMRQLGGFLRDHGLCGGQVSYLPEQDAEDCSLREWSSAGPARKPTVTVVVRDGEILHSLMRTPGLPDGDHDLYLNP